MSVYLDNRTNLWRYDFRLVGQRYSARGFKTKIVARNAEAARRREIEVGLTGQWPTFSELAQAWLADLATRSTAEWVKQCQWKLNKHATAIAHRPPKDIRPVAVQQILAHVARGTSPKAANELRKILAACFRWAVDMGGLERNPVLPVRRFPVSPPIPHVIPTAHLRALLVAADERLLRFLTVQALTGARRSEILRLRLADCQLEAVPPRIALRHAKGGERVRWRPLPAAAANALRQQVQGGSRGEMVWPGRSRAPLSREAIADTLKRACARAGIPRYGFHSIRRWAATHAIQSGFSDKIAAEFLGHSDTSVMSAYVSIEDRFVVEIGEALAAVLGRA